MIKILVVDDNEMDRVLVAHLLSDLYAFVYAEDGVQAVQVCEKESPDLVITDVVMPHMNGMELVSKLQELHPEIPLIVMTSEGSELSASEAIERGATSYVPKRYLSERLGQTVNQVVELMRADRIYSKLLQRMQSSHYVFAIENDFALIEPLVEFIQQIAYAEGICDQGTRHRLGIAIDEALFNAMYHGNLELPIEHIQLVRNSVRQESLNPFFDALCEEKRDCDRKVQVSITCTPERLTVVIEDQGRGFDHERFTKRSREGVNHEKQRGLLLIASIVDEMTYNACGNQLTLVKRAEAPKRVPENRNS